MERARKADASSTLLHHYLPAALAVPPRLPPGSHAKRTGGQRNKRLSLHPVARRRRRYRYRIREGVMLGGARIRTCTTSDECRRCGVVRLGHSPKRKKVAFDAVVAIEPHYSLQVFRAGMVRATCRAIRNDHDNSRRLPLLPSAIATVVSTAAYKSKFIVFKLGNADFGRLGWVRDFDLAGDMASEAVAVVPLDSNSVFVEGDAIRRLAMLPVGLMRNAERTIVVGEGFGDGLPQGDICMSSVPRLGSIVWLFSLIKDKLLFSALSF